MSHYINRGGFVEQVRYVRQEPLHMKHLPFDFQIKAEMRRKSFLDALIFGVCAAGLIAIYAWLYWPKG